MAKVKTIIVFGGTGFIGYHVCKRAVKKNFKVFSVSKKPPKIKRKIKGVKYLFFDITKYTNFKKIENSFNIVVNASGYGKHLKGSSGLKLFNSHRKGFDNILKNFKNKKIEKFIQIGSSFEYKENNFPLKESNKTKPKSYYGKAKLLITKNLLNLYKKNKFPVTILRIFQAYGPMQDNNRLIPYVISGLKKNKKIFLSEGNQIRDFCYIDDIVNAIFLSIRNKSSNGRILNIGSGEGINIINLVSKIHNLIRKGEFYFNRRKLHHGESKIIIPDITLSKKILKWRPKIKLNIGLKKTIASK